MPSLAAAANSPHHLPHPPNGDVGGVGTEIDGAHSGYIHHTVSKYDTLAGVAIKYGVEVADIKKLNGLVTDLQMFALPSLRIPLSGRRHPASHSVSNGSTSPSNVDLLTTPQQLRSSQQKISSSMNKLQKFYGLKPPTTKNSSRGTEIGVYKMRKSSEKSRTAETDLWLEKGLTYSDLLLMEPRDEAAEGSVDSYRRRWLKSELDVGWETPEKVLKEENDISSRSGFSSITGKGLALRPKSGSRATLASDDSGWLSSSSSSGDSPTADAPGKVHKSFSLSSMPDQDQSSFSYFWSNTKWNFKPDLQSLSTSNLTKPLLEGLPIVARKIKAALD
uniref:LysM domain-containing protein n=2 Tax=Kalanchoe fedtschenkoi TaxID=63787 RepID=A0A7N0U3K0_KALFE